MIVRNHGYGTHLGQCRGQEPALPSLYGILVNSLIALTNGCGFQWGWGKGDDLVKFSRLQVLLIGEWCVDCSAQKLTSFIALARTVAVMDTLQGLCLNHAGQGLLPASSKRAFPLKR